MVYNLSGYVIHLFIKEQVNKFNMNDIVVTAENKEVKQVLVLFILV